MKRPEFIRIGANLFNRDTITSIIARKGLFGGRYMIVTQAVGEHIDTTTIEIKDDTTCAAAISSVAAVLGEED